MTRKVLIAAAGTGGHIIPGIQIGRALEARNGGAFKVEYLCGSRPIEERIYSAEGIQPVRIKTGSFSGRSFPGVKGFTLLTDTLRLIFRFLSDRPAAVLAMGGGASVPALIAGRLLFIPLFLHESNAIPGRVVRLFRRFARRVFLGLGGLQGTNVVITGTPSRPAIESEEEANIILCVGGSQGAASLNRIFLKAIEKVGTVAFQPVLIAGPGKDVRITKGVDIREYEPDLPALLARARLIVSRSGSGALADISTFRIPAVLVPYPYAKDNHQLANARIYESRGAAMLLEEKDMDAEKLAEAMIMLLGERGAEIRKNLAELDNAHAADRICEEIETSLNTGRAAESATSGGRIQHEHP